MADTTRSGLTALEVSVLDAFFPGLGKQLSTFGHIVERREPTGVGLYLMFAQATQSAYEGLPSGFVGGVGMSCDEITNGIGYMLLIRNNKLVQLEGYTLAGEEWPATFSNPKVFKIPDASTAAARARAGTAKRSQRDR